LDKCDLKVSPCLPDDDELISVSFLPSDRFFVTLKNERLTNKSESDICAGIFISDIELFERPELSDQIEPSAVDSEKGERQ